MAAIFTGRMRERHSLLPGREDWRSHLSRELEPKPGRIYASGVLAADRIYYVSREQGTYVVDAKPTFRQLAHNRIESDTSIFNATPAISRGQLFLRAIVSLLHREN